MSKDIVRNALHHSQLPNWNERLRNPSPINRKNLFTNESRLYHAKIRLIRLSIREGMNITLRYEFPGERGEYFCINNDAQSILWLNQFIWSNFKSCCSSNSPAIRTFGAFEFRCTVIVDELRWLSISNHSVYQPRIGENWKRMSNYVKCIVADLHLCENEWIELSWFTENKENYESVSP